VKRFHSREISVEFQVLGAIVFWDITPLQHGVISQEIQLFEKFLLDHKFFCVFIYETMDVFFRVYIERCKADLIFAVIGPV
jgi:hypothetical protein